MQPYGALPGSLAPLRSALADDADWRSSSGGRRLIEVASGRNQLNDDAFPFLPYGVLAESVSLTNLCKVR